MSLTESLRACQGHGISDEDEEAYILGYKDAVEEIKSAEMRRYILETESKVAASNGGEGSSVSDILTNVAGFLIEPPRRTIAVYKAGKPLNAGQRSEADFIIAQRGGSFIMEKAKTFDTESDHAATFLYNVLLAIAHGDYGNFNGTNCDIVDYR